VKRWIITLADNIDIWITRHFNMRPKQRALEWHIDHLQDPYITKCLNEALEIQNDDNHRKETTDPRAH